MATPTELARDALQKAALLELDLKYFRTEVARLELETLRERVAVLEERVAELKKMREEAEKRYWQFVVLFVGGLVTLAINLVVSFVRK